MQICDNIKTIRESKGISVTEIARRVGIPRTSYGNYENETEPDVDTIKKIAKALGVHYVQVIDGPGTEEPIIEKEPDRIVNVTILKSQLDKVRASLNALDSAFLLALAPKKDKQRGLESGSISGKRKRPPGDDQK